MPRGGARPNAGRKQGSQTRRTQEIIAAVSNQGESPLEYMLRIMRTSDDEKRRDTMAIAAASYLHPRLAAVEMNANVEVTQEDRLSLIKRKANGDHDLRQ